MCVCAGVYVRVCLFHSPRAATCVRVCSIPRTRAPGRFFLSEQHRIYERRVPDACVPVDVGRRSIAFDVEELLVVGPNPGLGSEMPSVRARGAR